MKLAKPPPPLPQITALLIEDRDWWLISFNESLVWKSISIQTWEEWILLYFWNQSPYSWLEWNDLYQSLDMKWNESIFQHYLGIHTMQFSIVQSKRIVDRKRLEWASSDSNRIMRFRSMDCIPRYRNDIQSFSFWMIQSNHVL